MGWTQSTGPLCFCPTQCRFLGQSEPGERCKRRNLAEGGRFELPIPLRVCRISSAVHSTTLPPLRGCWPRKAAGVVQPARSRRAKTGRFPGIGGLPLRSGADPNEFAPQRQAGGTLQRICGAPPPLPPPARRGRPRPIAGMGGGFLLCARH